MRSGRHGDFANRLAGNRRLLRQFDLHDFQIAFRESGKRYNLIGFDFLLDQVKDNARGGNRGINAEFGEKRLVNRGVDTRNRPCRSKLALRHLADDKVILVLARNRDNHIGASEADLLHDSHLAPVALKRVIAQFLNQLRRSRPVFLKKQDFVTRRNQVFR